MGVEDSHLDVLDLPGTFRRNRAQRLAPAVRERALFGGEILGAEPGAALTSEGIWMSKRTFIGVMVVALVVVLAAGGVLASNMGFKLNYTLNKAAVGVSNSGNNTLGLPDNMQSGMVVASDLFNDIGGKTAIAAGGLQKLLKVSDTYQAYNGRATTGPNFTLDKGDGYFVQMANDVNYIIVGSHDPSFAHPLKKAAVGVSNSGNNFFSMPYNFTGTVAADLFNDIGGKTQIAAGGVQKLIKATDAFQAYNGRATTGPNFTLVPGEAYLIQMANDVNYIPSHY